MNHSNILFCLLITGVLLNIPGYEEGIGIVILFLFVYIPCVIFNTIAYYYKCKVKLVTSKNSKYTIPISGIIVDFFEDNIPADDDTPGGTNYHPIIDYQYNNQRYRVILTEPVRAARYFSTPRKSDLPFKVGDKMVLYFNPMDMNDYIAVDIYKNSALYMKKLRNATLIFLNLQTIYIVVTI